ncbi:hypothetical protein [Mesorhizobium opportunistum]|uniref:hypothetical protein n=1 Tax=Mesorhizobium opportunistum TaxID=593909 RepID=UPI0025768DA7|nr:hypothetical protein [Mesorhizobium opportunistum]WJI38711.1 hypothetical protein NL534_34010 [Mesorhizobium opportunistum]
MASDGANTSIVHHVTISVAAPAGTAGAADHLALTDPSDGQAVTVTVKDVPSGWTIDGATQMQTGPGR